MIHMTEEGEKWQKKKGKSKRSGRIVASPPTFGVGMGSSLARSMQEGLKELVVCF